MNDSIYDIETIKLEREQLVTRYDGQVDSASGWTGVACVHDGKIMGSGVLLASGTHLLTAAHVVNEFLVGTGEVDFFCSGWIETRSIAKTTIYPDYLSNNLGTWNDLALVTITQAAPAWATRSSLYLGDVVGKSFSLVGFGQLQDNLGNALSVHQDDRKTGVNVADTLGSPLASAGIHGSLDAQIFFDFDDGTLLHDALGQILGTHQLGLGGQESMITPGDSGGGLFVNESGAIALAGINIEIYSNPPTDLSYGANGSVGDIGVATRVANYASWIAQQTREVQVPVPQKITPPATGQVPMTVKEGEGVWFLAQLGAAAEQNCSVHFTTRDGTAHAGDDYVPTSGTLALAAGERWAKVWVQTLADNVAEGNETFYLVLSTPQGANFPAGHSELTASRTIVDDVKLTGVTQFTPELWG